MTGSRLRGRLESILTVFNASVVILGLAYLLLDPSSFIRRPIGHFFQRRRAASALRSAWPDVASQGMWFNRPSAASGLDTVVVFSDYECPYCRQFHLTLVALQEQNVLPAVRYRSLPLVIHPHARLAAQVAICADEQGSFLRVHRYLMERTSWQVTEPDSLPALLPVNDVQALRSCLRSRSTRSADNAGFCPSRDAIPDCDTKHCHSLKNTGRRCSGGHTYGRHKEARPQMVRSPFSCSLRAAVIVIVCLPIASCRKKHDSIYVNVQRPGVTVFADTIIAITNNDTLPLCGTCRIVVDSVTSIGTANDSVFARPPTGIVEGSDQAFYVAALSAPGRIARYDWHGHLDKLLGRTGDGPGELRWAMAVSATADSFLAVLDYRRIVWFPLPDGPVITEALLPPIAEFRAIALPRRGFVAAVVQDRSLRTFIYRGPDGTSRTFGDSSGPPDSHMMERQEGDRSHWLTALDSNRFWAMPEFFESSVEEWSTDGALLRRYRPPAPWFVPYGPEMLKQLGSSGIRAVPLAMSKAVWRDSQGRMWTLTQVPDPHWRVQRDAGAELDERGERHATLCCFDRRKVVDGIIAVYQVTDSSIALIASRRVDMPLVGILSDTIAVEGVYPSADVMTFNVFRFRLVGSFNGGQ